MIKKAIISKIKELPDYKYEFIDVEDIHNRVLCLFRSSDSEAATLLIQKLELEFDSKYLFGELI